MVGDQPNQTKPNQTMVKKKKKDSPGEHGWCWQEDHSVRSDRLQLQLLSQGQLAMSLPGDGDDIIAVRMTMTM